jgi:hypothetical protein
LACSAQRLIAMAQCTDSCVPPGMMQSIEIALACSWVNAGPCTLPTAPVDLGASAGDGQVTLTWPAGVGATGYNIKRALATGGPYTVIGTSASSPYVDHTASNGTEYFYVVSATNSCGESTGNSLESHATPVASTVTTVILPDGSGGFWSVVVATDGNIELVSDPGPQTADVILRASDGRFWKMIAFTDGNVGAQTDPGPATVAPVIADSGAGNWQLWVSPEGNLGAQSIP